GRPVFTAALARRMVSKGQGETTSARGRGGVAAAGAQADRPPGRAAVRAGERGGGVRTRAALRVADVTMGDGSHALVAEDVKHAQAPEGDRGELAERDVDDLAVHALRELAQGGPRGRGGDVDDDPLGRVVEGGAQEHLGL